MCTPWTMTWNIRWRVRDWTSCFTPCRLPLGDHELASSTQVQVRKHIAFDKKKDNSVKPIHNNNLSPRSEKCNRKRHTNKEKEGFPIGNRVDDDDSIRTLSADEGYIVFSFREDGAFDVIQDYKGVKSEADGKHQNSRLVNRKVHIHWSLLQSSNLHLHPDGLLNYGEGAEQVSDHHIKENISNANQRDTDQHDQEDEEKVIINLSQNQHRDNIRRTCQTEEIEEHEVVSTDSRDSNLSEGSTGSFAFPVLGWEWIESPVKMPKSEDLRLKKQKVRCVRFQCCRF